MTDIREKLNLNIESPYWDEAYAKAIEDDGIPEWMTEKYLRELQEETGLIPDILDILITAIPYVCEVPELLLLAKTLYNILALKKSASEAFPKYEQIKAPEGVENPIGYDLVAAFPIIAHLRPSRNELLSRGVDEDIVKASLIHANGWLRDTIKLEGKPTTTTTYFMLQRVFLYVNQLFIGRLRFELHENSNRPSKVFKNKNGDLKVLMCNCTLHRSGYILGSGGCNDAEGSYDADFVETETTYEGYAVGEESHVAEKTRTVLQKSEWTPVFVPGDTVLKVHISPGPGFTKEACDAAFARAREVLTRCYPEYDFKGFVTCCWMLSPVHREILKPESNIISFQNRFKVFPAENKALDVYQYVYKLYPKSVEEVDFASLPEENSMQRGVKKMGLEGKFVQECNGFIPYNE
ncbi:MAG: hypothetical protein IKM21_02630 [Oscillospiraceae bacterium]|nr:hypothetical protein [Oscillospiraceae bacterium]